METTCKSQDVNESDLIYECEDVTLEIAEKISQLTGIKAPIFVDNAEAINALYRPEGLQLVAFYVTDPIVDVNGNVIDDKRLIIK